MIVEVEWSVGVEWVGGIFDFDIFTKGLLEAVSHSFVMMCVGVIWVDASFLAS